MCKIVIQNSNSFCTFLGNKIQIFINLTFYYQKDFFLQKKRFIVKVNFIILLRKNRCPILLNFNDWLKENAETHGNAEKKKNATQVLHPVLCRTSLIILKART